MNSECRPFIGGEGEVGVERTKHISHVKLPVKNIYCHSRP